MLVTLRIKNLALVTDLVVEFQPNYNVVTGETGAGKSILIGALNLVLGERADRTVIRAGAENCSVEALFDLGKVKSRGRAARFLDENGLERCDENQLVLRRAISAAGANRQFINGSPATLSQLVTIGQWLVDIHGPHEHQSLLQPLRQLEMVDAFGKLEPEREALSQLLAQRARLQSEKASLIVDERTYAQQLDLLRFQVREIKDACLEPGEDERVEEAYRRASSGARLLELSRLALEHLSENDTSIVSQTGAVTRALQEMNRLDPSAVHLLQLQDQWVNNLHELQLEISRYADKVEVDPDRLAQMEERLNLLQSFRRKYGPSMAEVIAFGEEAAGKLVKLEQREGELKRINQELEKLDASIRRACDQLSARRRKLVTPLGRAVKGQLADLGFKQSVFEIALRSEAAADVDPGRVPLHGTDAVDFQFAPNPGEPARPLRVIASSGELARVMLALKTVLAAEDEIPVLVFDEVDANVGGETAKVVGQKMQQLAKERQVLCITHLPQVAAPAAAHFLASKHVRGGRTISEITLLAQEARVEELTRMLGGQSDAARHHAEALLGL
jgi:DNA repair protein RecN (Recombination protein N)